MVRFVLWSRWLLFLCFASVVLPSVSGPVKAPQDQRVAGVFMLPGGGANAFDFTAARAACLSLNVTMATMAQMERALQRGLETCKFGWTAEQITAVPRLTANQKCGQNKTGVVTWRRSPDTRLGVFCFNASDLEETTTRWTDGPRSSAFSTSLMALTSTSTSTSTPAPPQLRSTSPASTEPSTTPPSDRTSAFTLLARPTPSTRVPSASTGLEASSARAPSPVPHAVTSKPADIAGFPVSPSASSVSATSASPAKRSLGDVATALIILCIVLLLLAAAGFVWYHKLNIFQFWPHGRHKDDIETEMWKHTDSEMDLYIQHDEEEDEEEEADRKYSSDITLCVNPAIKTISLE